MSRNRRVEDLIGGHPPVPGAIFGPEDDNTIPGEVVLALQADAAASIDISVPSSPLRMAAAAGEAVTRLGATSVDNALARLDVTSISRLHGATPPDVVRGVAMASDFGLDGTFRVRYGAATKPDAVAERLNKLDEVAWAEPNRYREDFAVIPNDPMFTQQWGLTRIGCPDAWDRTTGSAAVTVAVVDTGVDLNHPELAPLLVAGQDLVDFPPGSTPRPGWVFEGDFMGVDADPQDENGHGTHVAGTIACVSNNGVGVTGVTWSTRLMPVRVLVRIREIATGRIRGVGSSANIAAGIRWAADHGAQVINMSLGGYEDARVEREAIAYAVARGVVVVAAMGNDNVSDPSFPAAYPDVIAVGATDSTDRRASFSNIGNWIDVMGPGVGIRSTYWDNTYATLDGTSMASPHVAGVAAMILAVAPTTTAAQVGNILRSTARPLRDAPADPVPNDRYGHGLVQAAAAVAAAAPIPPTRVVTCTNNSLACPSVVRVCQSRITVCQPPRSVLCDSAPVLCQPSLLCASRPPLCPLRSVNTPCFSIACPSLACQSVACGPDGPIGPGQADFESYDPYGYDPYGSEYE